MTEKYVGPFVLAFIVLTIIAWQRGWKQKSILAFPVYLILQAALPMLWPWLIGIRLDFNTIHIICDLTAWAVAFICLINMIIKKNGVRIRKNEMPEIGQKEAIQETSSSKNLPVSVLLLAVLGLIFAARGSIGSLSTLIINPPHLQQMPVGLKQWMFVSLYFGIAASAWLLAQSLGLLQKRGWARRSAIIYAWTAVGYNIIAIIVLFVYLGANAGIIRSIFPFFYPVLLLIYMRKQNVIAAISK